MSKVASENNTDLKLLFRIILMDIIYHQSLLMNALDDANDITLEQTRSWEMLRELSEFILLRCW